MKMSLHCLKQLSLKSRMKKTILWKGRQQLPEIFYSAYCDFGDFKFTNYSVNASSPVQLFSIHIEIVSAFTQQPQEK